MFLKYDIFNEHEKDLSRSIDIHKCLIDEINEKLKKLENELEKEEE